MKNEIVLVFLFLLSLAVNGQDKKAEFLKEPSTWEFERFTLPPTFASNFPIRVLKNCVSLQVCLRKMLRIISAMHLLPN
jgi:hypothetical protein